MKTVREIIDQMEDMNDSDRAKYLRNLTERMTPMSYQSIVDFQQSWDGSKSFEEFKKAQEKVIKAAITMELSDIGKEMAKIGGVSSDLTWETEIE